MIAPGGIGKVADPERDAGVEHLWPLVHPAQKTGDQSEDRPSPRPSPGRLFYFASLARRLVQRLTAFGAEGVYRRR